MSFKQIDSTNDALSVKKTRPSYMRSGSNMRRDSKVEILSPPREESISEDRNTQATRSLTPFKSSIKSSDGRKDLKSPRSKDTKNNEGSVPVSKDEIPKTKSSPGRVSSRHSINRPIEPQSITPTRKPSSPDEVYIEGVRGEKHMDSSTSRDWKSPGVLRSMTQVDGSPERPQPSHESEPAVAYQVGSSFKVLKAHSTMRSQPKIPHVDPESAPKKLRSSVWRTSSRGSATSGNECEDEQVNEQLFDIKRDTLVIDQMDGAGDAGPLSVSCRISLLDHRRDDAVKQNETASHLLVTKSRPRGLDGQSKIKQPSSLGLKGDVAKPLFAGQPEMTPNASKVRGLAAMFDTAAKASSFVSTPGGVIQKKRRETARVVSPYTSNPSPRTSIQTVYSVSTPVSFMSPSKSSVNLSGAADSTGKRSFVPRIPNSPLKDNNDKEDKSDKQLNCTHSRRNESRLSGSFSTLPSRIPTPSRLFGKKKDSIGESAFLPQLDGSSKMLKLPLRLTPQHAIWPTGYLPSAIPQLTNCGSLKSLPRLPQYSTEFFYSDDGLGERNKGLIPSSPSLSSARNPSSLRDRIRSLRSELSSKNEDCAQLRLEFEDFRNMKELSEILLREDLDRARGDVVKWKRRAEVAERKVESFERLAARIKFQRQLGRGCDQAQEYSFLSRLDDIDIPEHSLQPLTARMNQSLRRTSQIDENGADPGNLIGGGMSDCSENTILRNVTGTSRGDGSVANGSPVWSAVDDPVDFASPGFADESL